MVRIAFLTRVSVQSDSCPTSGSALTVRVSEDLVVDAGVCKTVACDDERRIARITPPETPMFLQVVEYLEMMPVPKGGNLRRAEEARAAVAVCLRCGSYFSMLADPLRPTATTIDDERTSQIADDEMARMNIEISAGIAWWLALRGEDESRYWDLVHRALAYLPTGPKSVRVLAGSEILLACATSEMAEEICHGWPADRLDQTLTVAQSHGIRVVANAIIHHSWRNGPVEDVHAGWAGGYEVGARRVSSRAEKVIIRQAQRGLYTGLKAVDFLKFSEAWPPPAERALPFLHPLIGPSRWSHTEQSRAVELPIRQSC